MASVIYTGLYLKMKMGERIEIGDVNFYKKLCSDEKFAQKGMGNTLLRIIQMYAILIHD